MTLDRSVNCNVGVVQSGPVSCELNCCSNQERHLGEPYVSVARSRRPSEQSRSLRRLGETNRYVFTKKRFVSDVRGKATPECFLQ